jgi:5-methylcytosine-specific restriction protein A
MGGMRKSNSTGTLVIVSDETKGLYKDIWKNGVLHYTGMGKIGDQVLDGNQNATLFHSRTNGIEVHLFEVLQKRVYTYRGVVALAGEPYQADQADDNGDMRKVWVFPVEPIDEAAAMEVVDPPEKTIKKFSDQELARRAAVKPVGKTKRTINETVYYRDPYLKEMVKRIAEGKCQLCGKEAPFIDKNDEPYLEEHHVVRLADGGADSMENIVAVCPNCHRKMHVLDRVQDKEALLEVARQNKKMFLRMLTYAEMVEKDLK